MEWYIALCSAYPDVEMLKISLGLVSESNRLLLDLDLILDIEDLGF